jgi:hypothetical protein
MMPVQHAYTIKAGSVSKLLLVFARDGSGEPRTGLRHDTAGATTAYVREGESRARAVPLAPGEVGVFRSGGFVEVDPGLLPGVYQLGAPDEMLAEGAARALLLLRFPGATLEPVEIHLVGYDPQDVERLGMRGLANRNRHEFLRQALPRLTEMELSLGEEAERRLNAKLSAE